MIFGVGIDHIEVARVEEKLTATTGLKERLFTPNEIAYCESQHHGYKNFAARFAAKEAFFKALGTGWRHGMAYTDIEIVRDELGKPACHVTGKVKERIDEIGITGIHVSLTHVKDLAGAMVLLEK